MNREGVIGYVNHTYNPRSTYQQTGCFFIAVAPFITALVICMASFDIDRFHSDIKTIGVQDIISFTLHQSLSLGLTSLQSVEKFLTLILVSTICFHCIPSNADFKNATQGAVYVLTTLAIFIIAAQVAYPILEAPLHFLIGALAYVSQLIVPLLTTYLIASTFWFVLFALSFVGQGRER